MCIEYCRISSTAVPSLTVHSLCVLNRPPETIDTLQALIKESQSVPIRLPSMSNLEQVIHQATEWSAEVDASLVGFPLRLIV